MVVKAERNKVKVPGTRYSTSQGFWMFVAPPLTIPQSRANAAGPVHRDPLWCPTVTLRYTLK